MIKMLYMEYEETGKKTLMEPRPTTQAQDNTKIRHIEDTTQTTNLISPDRPEKSDDAEEKSDDVEKEELKIEVLEHSGKIDQKTSGKDTKTQTTITQDIKVQGIT